MTIRRVTYSGDDAKGRAETQGEINRQSAIADATKKAGGQARLHLAQPPGRDITMRQVGNTQNFHVNIEPGKVIEEEIPPPVINIPEPIEKTMDIETSRSYLFLIMFDGTANTLNLYKTKPDGTAYDGWPSIEDTSCAAVGGGSCAATEPLQGALNATRSRIIDIHVITIYNSSPPYYQQVCRIVLHDASDGSELWAVEEDDSDHPTPYTRTTWRINESADIDSNAVYTQRWISLGTSGPNSYAQTLIEKWNITDGSKEWSKVSTFQYIGAGASSSIGVAIANKGILAADALGLVYLDKDDGSVKQTLFSHTGQRGGVVNIKVDGNVAYVGYIEDTAANKSYLRMYIRDSATDTWNLAQEILIGTSSSSTVQVIGAMDNMVVTVANNVPSGNFKVTRYDRHGTTLTEKWSVTHAGVVYVENASQLLTKHVIIMNGYDDMIRLRVDTGAEETFTRPESTYNHTVTGVNLTNTVTISGGFE